ncbi:MAG TPA: hypothetical protein VMV92_13200 [Streptosporangiaceae bacterium]|nr:hypothetical protein [Streptosporangiaceae bacterium]
MLNSALAIHLLLRVLHMMGGVTRPLYWIGCPSHPGTQVVRQIVRSGCVVIRFAPHSVRMTW